MAETNKRLVKVDTVVREALLEMGEDTMHKYPRALSFALSYYRVWIKEKAREYNKKIFTLDSLKRLKLPENFVDWVRIGVIEGNRIIPAFENRDAIGIGPKNSCGARSAWTPTKDARSLAVDAGRYPGGSSHSGLYGPEVNSWGETTGGYSGLGGNLPKLNFKYLEEENALQFNTGISLTSVYMEYLVNPFNVGSETLVHFYAIDPMKEWIFYNFARHNKNVSRVTADDFRRTHKKTHIKAGIQMAKITPYDILTHGRMLDHQGPRI